MPTAEKKLKIEYPPVLTKQDFVERYIKSEFGNRPRSWDTLQEFMLSGFEGMVHIRNRIAGNPTWYDIPWYEVAYRHRELIAKGINPDLLYFSEMGPEENKIFQGEVLETPWGILLRYNREPTTIRQATYWRETIGLHSLLLLQAFLCPNSYEWMRELLDRYPSHVVEFSTYSINWGELPNFNTVYWEVRRY